MAQPQVVDPFTGLGGADLAARYEMAVSGARTGLADYTRQLWSRRHFIASFANAKVVAVYSTARLGQIWQVLTPMINAGVYYLIFGVILQTSKGIPHFIPFLTAGVFLFAFTTQSVLGGVRAIADNLNLIRALHFPRACMPLTVMLTQLQQLMFSVVALLVIVVLNGQRLTLRALMLVPVLVLLAIFNAGLAMIFARVGAKNTDMSQVMPFVLRTWMYLSGVMYDIHSLKHVPPALRALLELNPMAIFIDLARQSLDVLKPHTSLPRHVWLMAAAWSVTVAICGYVWFWRSEAEYGRG